MRIPLASPDITDEDVEAVTGVLRTSGLSPDPKVGDFERAISRYLNASDVIAVSSGTSGLHL
jgi:perosamine synthetase